MDAEGLSENEGQNSRGLSDLPPFFLFLSYHTIVLISPIYALQIVPFLFHASSPEQKQKVRLENIGNMAVPLDSRSHDVQPEDYLF